MGFVYYGLIFILPRTLSSQTSDGEVLMSLLLISLIEIPTALVPPLLMEIRWLGRKNLITICAVLQFLSCILCVVFIARPVIFRMVVAAFGFVDLVYFDMLYPYTSELYETCIRGTGFSWATAWARLGGFVSPFALLYLHNMDSRFPYIAMGVVSFFAVLNACSFKRDTRGIDLDAK